MLTYLISGSMFLFFALALLSDAKIKELPEIIKRQYGEIANSRADEIEKELSGLLDQVKILSQSSFIKAMDMEAIKRYLPELVLDEKIRNMTIAAPDGFGWTTRGMDIDISEQEQYRKIFIEKQEYSISQPFISPYADPDMPVVIISHAIRRGKENVGLINVVIEVEFMSKIVRQMDLGETGHGFIVNSQGMIVAHPDIRFLGGNNIRDYMSNDEKVIHRILDSESGTVEYENENGMKMLGFFKKIDKSPNWTLIISISEDEVYNEVKNVRKTIFIGFLICFLLVIIFSYIYSDRISRPILKMKEVFEKAADGDLHVRADERHSNEIGAAAISFNIMLDKIKELTYKDTVTGLYNYNGFSVELPYKIKKLKKSQGLLAIGIISIDDFKRINSIIGYDGGNDILKLIAENLKKQAREDEVIGRFFGDEYILLLWEKDTENMEKRVEDLWKYCSGEINVRGNEFILKNSTGVSIIKDGEYDYNEVMHQATLAKLVVKKNGGNDFRFYNMDIDCAIKEEQRIENELYHAIEKNQLYLLYQPVVDVHTGRITGAEALLRWRHDEFGKIPIIKIIKIAEQSSLIIDIGNWVLKEACKKNKEWQLKGYNPIVLSVNVSAFQFEQSNFIDVVKNTLEEIGLESKYLALEITETSAMDGVREKLEKMKLLKDMGIGIAIDDFGTGYSSMAYLTEFPIDTLKIDRSFVRDLSHDDNAKAIANTIINMAKIMNMRSIAEGVETEEQRNFLKGKGCDQIQGYLISKPTAPHLIEEKFF